MERFSALLAFFVGNSPVTICAWITVLSKQSRGWWFETPSRSLWRHCNDVVLSLRCERTNSTMESRRSTNHRSNASCVYSSRRESRNCMCGKRIPNPIHYMAQGRENPGGPYQIWSDAISDRVANLGRGALCIRNDMGWFGELHLFGKKRCRFSIGGDFVGRFVLMTVNIQTTHNC